MTGIENEDFVMKKTRRRAISFLLILSMLVSLECFSYPMNRVVAAKSTAEQIREKEEEKKKLDEKLKQEQQNISSMKGEKKSLQDELALLRAELEEVRANLEDIETRIADKNDEIGQTQETLARAIATEEEQYDSMQARVRKMYERNNMDYITSLLQAGSFGKLLNLATWFEKVEVYDKDKLQEYKDNRALIEAAESRLQQEKKELDHLRVEAQVEKSKVDGLISNITINLEECADQIQAAQQKALDYERDIKSKEEDLKVLQKKLEEELRKSREAAEGKWRTISEVSFDAGDRKLLANIIWCEAGNQIYEGQVAVGAVVINRVLSAKFPDSVVGVVYQKNQFSPASSGRLELALARDSATESCYRAADEAMAGYTNVGTCVFFRTPVPGLQGIRIGDHIFY